MKNKSFKKLSEGKRKEILMRILRSRTDGLLEVKEEVALVCAGMKRKQFQIRTFNDINSFVKVLDSSDNLVREIIYGDMAMKEFRTGKALVETGIAAMARVKMDSARVIDQLLIYIPETRRCKGQCVREKNICEHIETYTNNALCCGLQLVQA